MDRSAPGIEKPSNQALHGYHGDYASTAQSDENVIIKEYAG
jgi:hypothetical protein